MSHRIVSHRRSIASQHRGMVAVQVAIMLTALIGFSALAIDVGIMHTAKADLQKIADAAALAGASQLGNFQEAEELSTTVLDLAEETAIQYGDGQVVLGETYSMTSTDIEFGYSVWNVSAQEYEFTAVESPTASDNINALRITARRANGSGSNGPINLAFAGIFGINETDVEASATAILVPRDIVIVADLSGSYNDDSLLENYNDNDPNGINLYEVWQTLPKSSADGALVEAWLDANSGMEVQDAPSSYFESSYGFFSQLGCSTSGSVPVFGQTSITSTYDPSADCGLIRLRYKYQWNSTELGSTMYNTIYDYLIGLGYNATEAKYILASTSNSTTNTNIKNADDNSVTYKLDGVTLSSDYQYKRRYDFRAAVALGLVGWSSGVSGGKWVSMGWTAGDADYYIEDSEMKSLVSYPYPSGNWYEYITYMRDDETSSDTNNNPNNAVQALSSIKNRFGAKTWTNFLLEEKELNSETDVSHYAYANPLHLTKEALEVLMDDLVAVDSDDKVGMVTFGTTALLDYQLPDDSKDIATNTSEVEDMYRHRQAAHYSPATNIGEGIEFATNELDVDNPDSNARPEAQKVIVLLTDGMANIGPAPDYNYSTSEGIQYAKDAVQAAWDNQRAVTHCIGVGSGADMTSLDEMADLGHTDEAYWANGDFATIQTELEEIFAKVGGRRPVQLIE